MRTAYILPIVWLMAFISGCKDGGCYYTCCLEEDDCLSTCMTGVGNAEECTISAQEDCAEGDDGYLTRVEWTEVNGAFCDTCNSPACAPNWWEANRKSETTGEMPVSSAEKVTDRE